MKHFLFSLFASCSSCSDDAPPVDPSLTTFMSFSVPLESWRDLSAQLEAVGGRFVLRGFPEGSFEELIFEIENLREEKIFAPIDIDPEMFERYQIEEVPAFLLEEKDRFDLIFGNMRVDAVLQEMAEKGDCANSAKELQKFL